MKEIGGYFGMESFQGSEYYPELTALNSGRNALLYLLKARKIKKLYIPVFLCGSVSRMCERYGFDYGYYHISHDFLPVFDLPLNDNEYIYIVNYYGRISNDRLAELRSHFGNVIFDNVQAFFQKPVCGIDTVYSCRKFFGVPDGAYLSTNASLDEELEQDISMDRMKHILGRYEVCASDYYGSFKANDEAFKELPLRKMSEMTHNLLRAIDYDNVISKRNKNYEMLSGLLGNLNKLNEVFAEGAYAYPFYCENGMKLKRRLAEDKIYVATLWNDTLEREPSALERDYTENILPLPIDQRYDKEDMEFVARKVIEYM